MFFVLARRKNGEIFYCPLGKPTSRASQGRNKEIPSPNEADSQVHPRRRTAGAGPSAISTGVQNRSAWSIRETIVSGVSSAPTA